MLREMEETNVERLGGGRTKRNNTVAWPLINTKKAMALIQNSLQLRYC